MYFVPGRPNSESGTMRGLYGLASDEKADVELDHVVESIVQNALLQKKPKYRKAFMGAALEHIAPAGAAQVKAIVERRVSDGEDYGTVLRDEIKKLLIRRALAERGAVSGLGFSFSDITSAGKSFVVDKAKEAGKDAIKAGATVVGRKLGIIKAPPPAPRKGGRSPLYLPPGFAPAATESTIPWKLIAGAVAAVAAVGGVVYVVANKRKHAALAAA